MVPADVIRPARIRLIEKEHPDRSQEGFILKSHNRMEARDHMRSEQDYKINLKAEVEIRHLHEKIDHLLKTVEPLCLGFKNCSWKS